MLAVVLAAIYGSVTATGVVYIVVQVAIQGAVIYLVFAVFT